MLGAVVSVTAMTNAAAPVITSALTNGGTGVAAPTDEPTAVAAVTWVGTGGIAAVWSPLFRPYGFVVDLHGVFCHNSPKVSFVDASSTSRICELADMLIVVDDRTGGSTVDRRAVLVQAKLFSSGGSISTSGTAAHQLDLYSRWPSFNFTSSRYKINARNFGASGPGSVADSGRYGGIDISPRPAKWEHIVPSARMVAGTGYQLAEFLSEMVAGSAGFGREATPGGTDDWSETVDELLSVTATHSARLAASLGRSSRIRRQTATASLVSSALTLPIVGGGDVPPSVAGPYDTGPDDGVSVVFASIDRADKLYE